MTNTNTFPYERACHHAGPERAGKTATDDGPGRGNSHPSWAVTPGADLLAISQPARQRGVDEAAGLVPMEASFFIRGGKRLRLTL